MSRAKRSIRKPALVLESLETRNVLSGFGILSTAPLTALVSSPIPATTQIVTEPLAGVQDTSTALLDQALTPVTDQVVQPVTQQIVAPVVSDTIAPVTQQVVTAVADPLADASAPVTQTLTASLL